MLEKLKNRWKIQSNYQLFIILLVFTITGSATVFVKKFIFELIKITSETNLFIKVPVYILVVLVVYNILLLVVGFLFGQFNFFKEFEKKFFSKILLTKKQNHVEKVNL